MQNGFLKLVISLFICSPVFAADICDRPNTTYSPTAINEVTYSYNQDYLKNLTDNQRIFLENVSKEPQFSSIEFEFPDTAPLYHYFGPFQAHMHSKLFSARDVVDVAFTNAFKLLKLSKAGKCKNEAFYESLVKDALSLLMIRSIHPLDVKNIEISSFKDFHYISQEDLRVAALTLLAIGSWNFLENITDQRLSDKSFISKYLTLDFINMTLQEDAENIKEKFTLNRGKTCHISQKQRGYSNKK